MEDQLHAKKVLEILDKVFDDRAEAIVLLYYGYDWTDADLAKLFGISKGRIQVVRNNTLCKMRVFLKRKKL